MWRRVWLYTFRMAAANDRELKTRVQSKKIYVSTCEVMLQCQIRFIQKKSLHFMKTSLKRALKSKAAFSSISSCLQRRNSVYSTQMTSNQPPFQLGKVYDFVYIHGSYLGHEWTFSFLYHAAPTTSFRARIERNSNFGL